MPNPNDEPALTCEYECFNGTYVLVGGSAPEGYYCPSEAGPCNIDGDITMRPPVPIEEDPIPEDPPSGGVSDGETIAIASSTTASNTATYTYDMRSDMLYFSSGKADNGFGFFSSMTTEQFMANYPLIAEEVLSLKGMKSLASVKVTLPALPSSIVGRRET